MEELVQSTRALQQRNEAQERINRHLLEAFNAVQNNSGQEHVDLNRKAAKTDLPSQGKRGEEPSEDLDSTDEYTPAKGRTVKAYHPRKMKHYYTLREDRTSREDLARQEGQTGD
ncbi:hypothetical protein FNV43_RR16951 [Rhamnella rubrinervis]|uniref:Uncharacterized protein n=1 Tax=Rhamnella rubrinervis TaxID=2594499 RepID=A0A8K0MDY0_9ROSA|nr:hypothetical protein FNV43_RR16951 [Rhamnella rubrinervis]